MGFCVRYAVLAILAVFTDMSQIIAPTAEQEWTVIKMTNREAETLLHKLRSFHNGTYAVAIAKAIDALRKEKHGHWIEGNLHIKCSKCGYPVGHLSDNFCPNCGAKMDEEVPKKELTQAQLCEAFEAKYGNRRAISLDEAKNVVKELFE